MTTPFDLFRELLEYKIERFQHSLKAAQEATRHFQNHHEVTPDFMKEYDDSLVAYNKSYMELRREVVVYQGFVELYQCSNHECDQLHGYGKQLLNYATSSPIRN